MNLRFLGVVAARYLRSRRGSRGGTSTVLSVIGVAVGVMTLTAVLAVMNGFQSGFIASILEVSSYHLQIQGVPGAEPDRSLLRQVRSLPAVQAVVPFRELQVIAQGRFEAQRGCVLRAVPEAVRREDPGFAAHMEMVEGAFDLSQPGTVVLGVELARHLGLTAGQTLPVLTLAGSSFSDLDPVRRDLTITGLFRSGYYEFDLGLGFVSLATGRALSPQGELTYGVKLHDRFRDRQAIRRLHEAGIPYRIASWREFNRAFFGALLMEKVFMMVLVGLIFVVVGVNIHHALRRAVRERYEEIAVLKAIGAGSGSIRGIFLVEGLAMGLAGATAGMVLGLLVAANINEVFAAAETVTNAGLSLVEGLVFPLVGGVERFSLFSPTYFYISEVPTRVLPQEALLIYLFAVASCGLAALGASRRVSGVRPAEVLRYE